MKFSLADGKRKKNFLDRDGDAGWILHDPAAVLIVVQRGVGFEGSGDEAL